VTTGQVWSASRPRSVLMTNGLSAMGFGVPAAIAARLCLPDRPVVALVGDGGFAMTATEPRVAAELGLPVTVVVFADGSLNRIELRQQLMGYPPTATRLGGRTCPRWPRPCGPGVLTVAPFSVSWKAKMCSIWQSDQAARVAPERGGAVGGGSAPGLAGRA
jgi:Thiamine pyrophosphate enzyme, C-terminal TPP binding domain